MALVDYSSSDDEDLDHDAQVPGQHQHQPESKVSPSSARKTSSSAALPPLPAKFHDLYASTARVSTRDDPSLHGGRKRVTPHIQGNWPSHLYIECRSWNDSLVLHGWWFAADTVEGFRRLQNMHRSLP
jgi:hypothetical protein